MEVPSLSVRKGAWTEEEDSLLKKCIEKYGEGKWHQVPSRAGLNRCRKSCRLRWLNYLKPDRKRGDFAADEVDLIVRLHNLLGNRWSLIAGRIPGRTANDVKNYWNTHLFKKKLNFSRKHLNPKFSYLSPSKPDTKPIKPRPQILSKHTIFPVRNNVTAVRGNNNLIPDDSGDNSNCSYRVPNGNDEIMWWEKLLMNDDRKNKSINSMNLSVSGEQAMNEGNYGGLDELFLDEELWNVFNP